MGGPRAATGGRGDGAGFWGWVLGGAGCAVLLTAVAAGVVSRLGRSGPATARAGSASIPTAADSFLHPSSPDDLIRPPAKHRAMAPDELYRYATPAVARVTVKNGRGQVLGFGSGFFVSDDGLVVTNFHVIEGASAASVSFDNTESPVDAVVAVDRDWDLVLLRVGAQAKQTLTVSDEAPPAVGSKVYAIGCPEGLTNTLSEGLVSAIRRARDGVAAIQTTAAISHGSSGGPLLSPNGEVVGVTSAVMRDGQNLNFAVPAERVRSLLKMKPMLVPIASVAGDASDYLARARVCWKKGQEADAFEAWETVLRLDPTGKDGYIARKAMLHVCLDIIGPRFSLAGKHESALAVYKRALELDTTNPKTYAGIASAFAGLEQYSDALKACGLAIALAPNDAELRILLGDVYRAAGRYDQAKNAYFAAVQMKPDSTRAFYQLGMVCKTMGLPGEAAKWWAAAVRLDPRGEDVWASLARREIESAQQQSQQGGK